jgi:hypothetical protein
MTLSPRPGVGPDENHRRMRVKWSVSRAIGSTDPIRAELPPAPSEACPVGNAGPRGGNSKPRPRRARSGATRATRVRSSGLFYGSRATLEHPAASSAHLCSAETVARRVLPWMCGSYRRPVVRLCLNLLRPEDRSSLLTATTDHSYSRPRTTPDARQMPSGISSIRDQNSAPSADVRGLFAFTDVR